MKAYNHLLCVSLTFVFILMSANMGHGDELTGKVVKTIGKQVEVELEEELIPQIGDKVIIGFDMPSLGFVPLQGRWSVSTINPTSITADPDGDTRQPQKDQLVKIASPNPLSRKYMRQEADNLNEKAEDYFNGGKGENINYAKALEFYHKAANMGSLEAMNSLGYMYGTGTGVTKNNTKAVEWFRKAAEQNHTKAQKNLGVMYDDGEGVAEDDKIAMHWYLKAAEQGNATAQRRLGNMFFEGKGGAKQNYTKAAQWYRKAASQGDGEAKKNLGILYHNGWGVRQDDKISNEWYLKAAKQGNAMAQYNLGVVYENGQGVKKNIAEATDWYRKAAENGYLNAKKALTRLGQ